MSMTHENRRRLSLLLARYKLQGQQASISAPEVVQLASLLMTERDFFDKHVRAFYAIAGNEKILPRYKRVTVDLTDEVSLNACSPQNLQTCRDELVANAKQAVKDLTNFDRATHFKYEEPQ